MHRGDTIPFWQRACVEGRASACERLMQLEASYCADKSGWACNELGLRYVSMDVESALDYFGQACELRFQAGCVNLLEPAGARRADPRALDLRLLLREGGRNLTEMSEPELYGRACAHGWSFACS